MQGLKRTWKSRRSAGTVPVSVLKAIADLLEAIAILLALAASGRFMSFCFVTPPLFQPPISYTI